MISEIKESVKKILIRVKQRWDNIEEENKKKIIYFANYGFNAIPLSFLIYWLVSPFFTNSFRRFFITYLCTSIFMFYYEYYYKWHKEGWQEKE